MRAAPGSAASTPSELAASTSYSTSTSSAASRAAARVFRHHKHDALADETHAIEGKRVVRRHEDGLSVAVGQGYVGRTDCERRVDERLQPVGQIVGRRQDREHPRQFSCRGRFDALQNRVRMRRSGDRGECLAGKSEVIAESARSRDQALIFAPPRRTTDPRLRHGDAPRPESGPDVRPLVSSPRSPCGPGTRGMRPWPGRRA